LPLSALASSDATVFSFGGKFSTAHFYIGST
jgi:hypothetical protein